MTSRRRWGAGAAAGLLLGLVTGWLVQPAAVEAADHLDFPGEALERNGGALVENTADLSDLLAWMPDKGRMAVVMNSHPLAAPDALFSDALDYQFRFRRVVMTETGHGVNLPKDTGAEETVIRCSFDVDQVMTCLTPLGEMRAKPGETAYLDKNAIVAWSGVRADSFFVDIEAILGTIKSGATDSPALLFPREEPKNIVGQANVLSIALEFDVASVLGVDDDTDLVAVNVETARREARP